MWNFNSLASGANSSFRGLVGTASKRSRLSKSFLFLLETTFSLEVISTPSPPSALVNQPNNTKLTEPRLNLNQADNVGMTPLMLCAEAGQSGFRMVFGLVSAGCDISAVDKIGMTALHYACYVGAVQTVRFLLEEASEFSDKRACDLLNLQVSYLFPIKKNVQIFQN